MNGILEKNLSAPYSLLINTKALLGTEYMVNMMLSYPSLEWKSAFLAVEMAIQDNSIHTAAAGKVSLFYSMKNYGVDIPDPRTLPKQS